MMKNLKKLFALLIATLLVLAMAAPAMAATGDLTADNSLTIGGLERKDSVAFYKLIKWVEGEGWAWNDNVETTATSASVTLPELKTITGYLDTTQTPAKLVKGAISAADGGKLAQVAQKMSAVTTIDVADTDGANSVTYNKPTGTSDVDFVGLYVALVKPATTDYLYNPIFVSADFNSNPSATHDATDSKTVALDTLDYNPTALAKKEQVTLTKESGTSSTEKQYDVAVGDTISFTITSVIPAYSTSYLDPVYEITDVMDTGLTLNQDSITVKVKTKGSSDEYATLDAEKYEVKDKTATGFTVSVKDEYLLQNDAAKDIQVTYTAKVTAIGDTNVVQKNNTATVKFSNNPSNKNDYSLIEDKTNHYTFSLDANLLGETGWENSELVKVGLNPDGTEISETLLSNGTKAGVLEGAVFGLYKTLKGVDGGADDTLYTNNNVSPAVTGEFTSDAKGKLKISGLDAGTYYLKEKSAPAGYIKSTDVWKIVITPTYKTVTGGTYTKEGHTVKYEDYDYLESYKVEVTNLTTNTKVTSDFSITNEGEEKKTATKSSKTDSTTKLNNTRGTELPSTGGAGTKMLITIGSIFAIGFAVVLVSRRRAEER